MLYVFVELACSKGVQNFTVHSRDGKKFSVEYMLLYDQGCPLNELAQKISEELRYMIETIEADVNDDFVSLMDQEYLLFVIKN